jgi:glycine cleavage system transcriptional repressor
MHVALTAVGVDRPGIVAAITKALFEAGGNLEDSRMAILGAHFAVVLIVALPEGTDLADLQRSLDAIARELDLVVSLRPVPEAPAEHLRGSPYVVRVHGADHPGIVARVSGALAARGVNIRDLVTHVIEGAPPVYLMILEVEVPSTLEAKTLEAELRSLAAELEVDVSLEPMEPETL